MNKIGEKDFNGWMKVKEDVHRREAKPTFENLRLLEQKKYASA